LFSQTPPDELASADAIWQHLWQFWTLHLAFNIEDGFYIVEVVVIMDVETVKNSYMVPKKICTATNHYSISPQSALILTFFFFGTSPPSRSL
jgi:hypothetical protein